ncbi:MAG: SDR family NAD(P)-dependent oxidoreductase [Nitriliruptorales bacterium]|nr:SDR family NAD(P)-dependent oxidoreductase [Nitriliruptorales bacterium]
MAWFTDAIDAAMEATVVPSFTRIGPRVRRRLHGWRPLEEFDLAGARIVLTGANSGLGLAAARRLAQMGAQLHLLVRSEEKGRRTLERLDDDRKAPMTYGVADLTDLGSVRRFAADARNRLDGVDVLAHNAGAMFGDRRETVDGLERTFSVHVAGPYLLTCELLPELESAAPSRVIWMSSGGMYAQRLDMDRIESPDDYRPATAYARAKRAQVVLADLLQDRWGPRGISFHAMHPGWADTPGVARSLPGFRTVMGPLLRDAEQGADTLVWLAAAPEHEVAGGGFWHDRARRARHKLPTTRVPDRESVRLLEQLMSTTGCDGRGDASTSPPNEDHHRD